jgi:hypothetical protein
VRFGIQPLRRDFDFNETVISELDRVGNEILDYLPKSVLVAKDLAGNGFVDGEGELEVLDHGLISEWTDGLVDHRAQIELRWMELELALADAREVEQVVEQSENRIGRTTDHFEVSVHICG